MKAYYYGERIPGVLQKLYDFAKLHMWAIWPVVVLVILIYAIVFPVLWIMVMVGELGHTFAEAFGFDSREW